MHSNVGSTTNSHLQAYQVWDSSLIISSLQSPHDNLTLDVLLLALCVHCIQAIARMINLIKEHALMYIRHKASMHILQPRRRRKKALDGKNAVHRTLSQSGEL